MLTDILFDIQENEIHYAEIKNLETLIEAVNDWPGNPATLDEYLSQIRHFLNKKTLSISVIREAHKNINRTSYSWESESLTSLYRFLYMNSADSLEDLFALLAKYIYK